MSTYLALTFGTLLSSQGTDTSFRPPSSGPSGRFVLSCFQLIRCFPLRFSGVSIHRIRFPLATALSRRLRNCTGPGPSHANRPRARFRAGAIGERSASDR
ncbi:hypothetical protein F7Q99_19120 [Streptomyces kaniharaensis]|uniref:Uncharacterized protein n=1 Tax=Streptomyces kaniharaensis TaxID=212423 RepID=A0A6N7KWE1_9ACTN|nr:hypothetical protein [Streptomyces kaniharaensis]